MLYGNKIKPAELSLVKIIVLPSNLVTNDTTSGSSKNVAAQKLGIPILSEDDFINKFNLQAYVF